MKLEHVALLGSAAKGVGSGIRPDVAAVSPKFAKLNVVAMRTTANLEDEHQLMLTAVKGTHSGVVLRPDA